MRKAVTHVGDVVNDIALLHCHVMADKTSELEHSDFIHCILGDGDDVEGCPTTVLADLVREAVSMRVHGSWWLVTGWKL